MDSRAVSKLNKKNKPIFSEEFGQDVPNTDILNPRAGPPILPPHLLQVILNKVRVRMYWASLYVVLIHWFMDTSFMANDIVIFPDISTYIYSCDPNF